jgi:hypothetical protein
MHTGTLISPLYTAGILNSELCRPYLHVMNNWCQNYISFQQEENIKQATKDPSLYPKLNQLNEPHIPPPPVLWSIWIWSSSHHTYLLWVSTSIFYNEVLHILYVQGSNISSKVIYPHWEVWWISLKPKLRSHLRVCHNNFACTPHHHVILNYTMCVLGKYPSLNKIWRFVTMLYEYNYSNSLY